MPATTIAASAARRVPAIWRRQRTTFQLQLAGIVTEGFFNGIIDQADAKSLITMATSLWIISFSLLFFFASADIHSKFLLPFLRLPSLWKKMVFFFF